MKRTSANTTDFMQNKSTGSHTHYGKQRQAGPIRQKPMTLMLLSLVINATFFSSSVTRHVPIQGDYACALVSYYMACGGAYMASRFARNWAMESSLLSRPNKRKKRVSVEGNISFPCLLIRGEGTPCKTLTQPWLRF